MQSIYQNLRNDKQWKASTGMSQAQFERLYVEFSKLYFPKKGNPYTPQNKPALADGREALFFVLHHLKAYPTMLNMSLYFGISEASVSNYLKEIKPILKTALQKLGVSIRRDFLSDKDFEEWFADVDEILIDGVEVSVQRPVNDEIQKKNIVERKNFIPKNG
jgi:hypothetical protein